MSQQKHFEFRVVSHGDVGNIEYGLLRDGITRRGGANSCRSVENSQRKKGCVKSLWIYLFSWSFNVGRNNGEECDSCFIWLI